ncbi:MAG: DUF2169 domain-containing protein [Burkholderiales bacterium]|nr:DUF2169 domain-containing protein [Burkholderiales bacterium]
MPQVDPTSGAIAHQICEGNPLGLGFCRDWYVRAKNLTAIAAPQITYAHQAFDEAALAHTLQTGKMPAPASLGCLGRGWQPRLAKVGKVDAMAQQGYSAESVPSLPSNFDYGYWNCAPLDQQCRYLQGGEHVRLVNLCPANHAAAKIGANGNYVLDFIVPQHACVLMNLVEGDMLAPEKMEIDTLLINMLDNRIDITWRIALPVDLHIKTMRLLHLTKPEQIARFNDMLAARAALAPH